MTKEEEILRFWARVRKGPGECLLFVTPLNKDRYGHFWAQTQGKLIYAHRYAFLLAHGYIDENLEVMHSCDIRNCVFDGHLLQGTQAANVADMMVKGRGRFLSGEESSSSKLTSEQVRFIRSTYQPRLVSAAAIARQLGVTTRTVLLAYRGETWKTQETVVTLPYTQREACLHGHLLNAANTYVYRNSRRCRICRKAAVHRAAAKQLTHIIQE